MNKRDMFVHLQVAIVDSCNRVPAMPPELRQLRCFVTVAERSSFTAAAEELQIAQQAVSQQIKALETDLGRAVIAAHVTQSPAHARRSRVSRGRPSLLANADRAVTECKPPPAEKSEPSGSRTH
jgi:hypothetical protein